MTEHTKVGFDATPRTVTALESTADRIGLSKTDTANRAIQLYAAVTGMGLLNAVRVLYGERLALRRIAAEERAARGEAEVVA